MKTPKPPKVGSLKWSEIPEASLSWDCQTREACQQCTLHTTGSFTPWDTPNPTWNGKVLALGLSPSWLNGVAGTLFWRAVQEAGLTKKDILVSSVLRCDPEKDKKVYMKQLRACRPGLLQFIHEKHPQYILACGIEVEESLKNHGSKHGIVSSRGRVQSFKGIPMFTTYAPSGINTVVQGRAQSHLYDYLVRDLKRCKHMDTLEPEVVIPWKGELMPGFLNGTEKVLAVDTEYSTRELLDVSFANAHCANNYSLPDYATEIVETLADIDWICGHNVTAEVDQFVKQGWCKEDWATGKKVFDSMLIAHNSDENRGPKGFKLENVLVHDITIEGWKAETEEEIAHPETMDPAVRAERCRKDAWASAVIIKNHVLDARGSVQQTHRIAQAIHRLYHAGAYIDIEKQCKMYLELTMAMDYNKEMFQSVTAKGYKKEIDLTNDNHIRDFLFKHRKLKPLGKTKTGEASIEAKYVEYYSESEPDLVYLSEWLKANKIFTTYVSTLLEKTDDHGWLPVDIGMLTRTSRRHSYWHTWPASVKPLVRSRCSDGLISSFDYSKLEIIIMSVLAQEWKLYEYFTKGTGYLGIGEELLGTKVQKDTKEYTLTKATVFGMNYGGGPWSLARKLWYEDKVRLDEDYKKHEQETRNIVDTYFRMFPRLKVYQKTQEAKLLAHGYVEYADGRRRHLPLPLGKQTEGYRHMVREATNAPIQGTAALLTGSALVDVEDTLLSHLHMSTVGYHKALMNKDWPDAVLWMETHDSLGLDSCDDKAKTIMKETMEGLRTFRKLCPQFKDIQFTVEMKEGTHWQ